MDYYKIISISRPILARANMGLDFVSGQYGCLFSRCRKYVINSLIHGHFHIGLVIHIDHRLRLGPICNLGMITRPIWKCPCIKLFITYFQHLEKRHPYCPEMKSRPILARAIWTSIWKWSCSNLITGYFPGVWKYGQFTSGHIGHTKMPLFELSM